MKKQIVLIVLGLLMLTLAACEMPSSTVTPTIIQTPVETPTEPPPVTLPPPPPTATALPPPPTATPIGPTHVTENLLPWADYVRSIMGWDGSGPHWVVDGWTPMFYDRVDCRSVEQLMHEDLPSCRICEAGEPEVGCTPPNYDWSLWHTPEFASSRCTSFETRCREGPESQRIFFQYRLGYAGIETSVILPENTVSCEFVAYAQVWHTDNADETGGLSRITVYNDNGTVNVQGTRDARESMWVRLTVHPLGGGAWAASDWYGWDDNGGTFANPICQGDGFGNCGFGVYDRWQRMSLEFNPNNVRGLLLAIEVSPTFANHNQDFHLADPSLVCHIADG